MATKSYLFIYFLFLAQYDLLESAMLAARYTIHTFFLPFFLSGGRRWRWKRRRRRRRGWAGTHWLRLIPSATLSPSSSFCAKSSAAACYIWSSLEAERKKRINLTVWILIRSWVNECEVALWKWLQMRRERGNDKYAIGIRLIGKTSQWLVAVAAALEQHVLMLIPD